MSTTQRRRGKSLHIDLPAVSTDERPAISALFLIQFDAKAGYMIAWKQCVPGLELAESVEFKSLPSGLHNVQEDLVYFVHDGAHAGISAFVNKMAAKWERNALMLAVGALVPLEQGRLGRSWKHAGKLKELARQLALDPYKTDPLQEYWQQNHLSEEASPKGSASRPSSSRRPSSGERSRDRARSAIGFPGQGLSPYHPALSLPAMIDTFGPLIYPLYKAALLRKRILLMNEAPVELACNFVYNISIISNIPASVSQLIPLEPLPIRLQPLFSVGIHDIDSLSNKPSSDILPKDGSSNDPGYGWVACTTDDVLGIKTNLFDVLVTIPPAYGEKMKEKTWPRLRTSSATELKATQRDLRRYRTLRQGLRRQKAGGLTASPFTSRPSGEHDEANDEDDRAPLLQFNNSQETFDDASSSFDERLAEPSSWSALAYSSFMWWASAGEQRADLDEEMQHDAAMLQSFGSFSETPLSSRPRRRSSPYSMPMMTDGSPTAPEMTVIAYFHHLTATIMGVLAELADDGDDVEDSGEVNGKDGDRRAAVFVGSEQMIRMGLDIWSEGDRRFVEELLDLYWGRKADVEGGRIECCGVRIR